MKLRQLLALCLLTLNILVLPGCDDTKKKEEEAREERTKRSLEGNAGTYTPGPIDMSMGTPSPTPEAPKP